LRRALAALGVDNPEEVIARQREAGALFADELNLDEPELASIDAVAAGSPEPNPEPLVDIESFAPSPAPTPSHADPIVPSAAEEIDLPIDPPGPPPRENVEIDLSSVLSNLNSPRINASAGREEQISEAAALFDQAQEHLRRGSVTEAAGALQAAARVPQFRFKAAAQLGRLLAARGDAGGAIEWLERAAEAPATSPDEGFAVLYDLADALDRTGEPVRALAVFIELEADAGIYRDVRTRIEQLTTGAAGTSRGHDRERP
jgi:tetratricopeptide (TPR) repeat protein